MKAPLTLTLDSLATRLSQRTGADKEACVRFITAYFQAITDGVADGGSVTAKGLGTFRAVRGNVIFTPDAAYTEVVNAPFAAFAPIPLLDDENVPEPQAEAPAEEKEEEEEPLEEETEESVEEPNEEPIEYPENSENIEPSESFEPFESPEPEIEVEIENPREPSESFEPSEPPEPEIEVEIENPEEPSEPIEPETLPEPVLTYAEKRRAAKHRPSKCRLIVMSVVMLVAGLAVGLTAGYFFYYKINAFFAAPMGSIHDTPALPAYVVRDTLPVPVPTDTLPAPVATKAVEAKADTVAKAVAPASVPVAKQQAEQSAVKSAKKVGKTAKSAKSGKSDKGGRKARYDKIDKHTYLATLARKYYGNPEYWVYIYDANKKRCRLRHPDRIAPGTILRIPYKQELPLTGNDSADILTAKRRGTAIRAQY